jgi:ankyrin repeat protein
MNTLGRLMEAPEEAGEWVVSGKSDDDTIFEFLPLHLACLTNAPLLLVTLLLQACPDAVEEDTMGKLPIHMACEAQVDHRTVFLLLNRFPESLQIEDEDGNTPIEIASFADASEERKKIIQILTRKMENTVVRTPTSLYHAIDCQDWNYAMRHLVAMPQESTIWVSFTTKKTEIRFLPLHAACLMGAPLLLVEDLIQAYPDAIRKKTSDGKLPLHLVCESLPDCRVVKLLVDQYKDALQIKNNEGNTPLDVVSSMLISPERSEIIEILMSEEQNDDENIVYTHTKLHALIEERQWDGAVRRVLEAPDEASTWFSADKKTNKVKYLPLHKACTLRAPLILVAVLIQTYPDCVKKVGIARKLPIHIACENRTDHGVISFLLHSWPASFHAKDGKGLTCIQSALLSTPSSHRTKIIQALTAFEDKDGQPLTLQASETTKDENRNGDINGYQNKGSTYVQESLDSDEDIVKVEPVRKSRAKKKIYYTGKKHLFQRRKTKMLWDKDDKMFQSE